ncbi:hypothetical protein ABW19_dt0209118 [Dactylella cylindrospora]|nr:hypothetical protein ABW19_dt0209118 [Dactylella cylindrospora]
MATTGPSLSTLGFETLTPYVYYSTGDPNPSANATTDTAVASSQLQPDGERYDLVIVFGWMDASPRHLVKYIQLHRSLQPGVPIICIQSTAAAWLGFTKSFQTSLPVVYDVVKSLPENPKIFIHTFSNGGTGNLAQFLALYRYEVGSPMPVSAMVIDSAPGGGKFPDAITRGVNAFLAQVKNAAARAVLGPILFIFLTIFVGIPAFLGFEDPISRMRRTLNDETLVSEGGIRGYTYCKGDIMVDWKFIEQHADEASDRGWIVLKRGFEGGSHVGGYRQHPTDYEEFLRQIRRGK